MRQLFGHAVVIPLLLGLMSRAGADEPPQEIGMGLTLTSTAFAPGAAIPSAYTCEGRNVSPPLAWTEPPAGTNSLALISDDPDALGGTWVNWVVYNLTTQTRRLAQGVPTNAELADGTRQGVTDFGRPGYGGPCPPSGTHRYFFRLYALNAALGLKPGATTAQLEAALQGHVLAQGELMGTYRKKTR